MLVFAHYSCGSGVAIWEEANQVRILSWKILHAVKISMLLSDLFVVDINTSMRIWTSSLRNFHLASKEKDVLTAHVEVV